MRTVRPYGYSLMISLLPAIATIIGIVVLMQIPTRAEVLGVVLVAAGVALHREADAEAAQAVAPTVSGRPASSGRPA